MAGAQDAPEGPVLQMTRRRGTSFQYGAITALEEQDRDARLPTLHGLYDSRYVVMRQACHRRLSVLVWAVYWRTVRV